MSASTSDVTSNTAPTDLSQNLTTTFANMNTVAQCQFDEGTEDPEIGDLDSNASLWTNHASNFDSYPIANRVPSDVPEGDEDVNSPSSVPRDATPFANSSIKDDGIGEQFLAARKRWIVEAFMKEFYMLLSYRQRSTDGSSGNTSPSELSLSTSNASVCAAPGPESGAQKDVLVMSSRDQRGTARKGKKRARRTSDSEDGDPEEDDTGKHQHEPTIHLAAKARKRFACPYAKRFGRSSETPQACVHPGFDGIHRLKGKSGHLERDHVLAELHCPDCFKEFKRPRDLVEHSRAHGHNSCPGFGSIPITKMDREKWDDIQAINGKPPQNMSQEDQWKAIWCIIFSDDEEALANIPSPYIDALAVGASSDDQVNQYERYMRAALPTLVQARVEAALDLEPAEAMAQRLLGGIHDMVRSCQEEIMRTFRTERGIPVPEAFQHAAPTENDSPVANYALSALEPEIRSMVARERNRANQAQPAEQQHAVGERLILHSTTPQEIVDSAYRSAEPASAHQPPSSRIDETQPEQTEQGSQMGYTIFSGVDSAFANDSGTCHTGPNIDNAFSNFLSDCRVLPGEPCQDDNTMEAGPSNPDGEGENDLDAYSSWLQDCDQPSFDLDKMFQDLGADRERFHPNS